MNFEVSFIPYLYEMWKKVELKFMALSASSPKAAKGKSILLAMSSMN